MDLILTFVNHLLPMLITLAILVFALAIIVGGPYIKYIAIVANADTPEGQDTLAKYLARKAGGRKINVEHTWRSFRPAARDLHRSHVFKRRQFNG